MHPRALSTVTFPVRVVLCNVTRWEHPLIVTQKQSPVEKIKNKKKIRQKHVLRNSLLPVEVLQRQQ